MGTKLKQLEKANATDEADCERKMEKEKQMQMRRQAYLEQLDAPETKNVNENEIAKGKSKEGKKVPTKKITKKERNQKEKEKIHDLTWTQKKNEPEIEPKIVELFS